MNLRLAGQYFDEETWLHYNWNRYYDTKVGRYVTRDPIGFKGGQTNLYVYVGNSPAALIDATGLAGVGVVVNVCVEAAYPDKDAYTGVTGTVGASAAAMVGVSYSPQSQTVSVGFEVPVGGVAGDRYGTYPENPPGIPPILGAYAGGGLGGYVTNAPDIQTAASIPTITVGGGLISVQYGKDPSGNWILIITVGPGVGASSSNYPTNSIFSGSLGGK